MKKGIRVTIDIGGLPLMGTIIAFPTKPIKCSEERSNNEHLQMDAEGKLGASQDNAGDGQIRGEAGTQDLH